MNQKVALITDSATGIGKASALRFAKEGYSVVVNYSRSQAEAEQTLAEVKNHGVSGILCCANVADENAVVEMIRRSQQEFGGLDVVVNNAGTTKFIDHTDLDSLTSEVWDEILGVNVKGSYFCCKAAMPFLKERRGNIVNVTSVAGVVGRGSSIAYAASKAAIDCMTKSLARAFGPEVRVNAVAPGPVLTRWLADHQTRVDESIKITPMGRASTPEDIADVIFFLASGTNMMTGQVLVVDGGRTM